MNRSFAPAILLPALLAIVSGCAFPRPATTPPESPAAIPSAAPSSPAPSSPNPSINLPITTPDAAAALVIASDPRFAGIGEQDPNMIGACCFYTASQRGDGTFQVAIEIGWGDCPAGCTDRHHWFYTVATDGSIHLDREDGPAVPAGVPGPGDGTTGGVIGIRGIATAGPVCPVVTDDPGCADRPVVGALVHVIDASGTEVATMETDATGAFVVTLPPGRYRIVPDPVEGLMGTAAPVVVTVGASLVLVRLAYDTGIR